MIKRSVVQLFCASVFLAVTACSGRSSVEPDINTDYPKITQVPGATATIDVCKPFNVPDIVFPRQEPIEEPREVMEAELVGDLVTQDGCLWVDSFYQDGSFLPIWPPEFTLVFDEGTIVILDSDGIVAGRVGEEIYMGGGIGSGEALPDCVRQQIPVECGGPYWVVGEGVRPNIRYDSALIHIELISTADHTAILLNKAAALDEWTEEPSIVSGKLRLYTPQRCPRIQSVSGITDYLPIWPPGYSLVFKDDLVEVLDDSGDLVAKEGDDLILHGGPIPHSWDSENYRQLYHEIPGDCPGPYWIVNE